MLLFDVITYIVFMLQIFFILQLKLTVSLLQNLKVRKD
jgi:hypothetical protein